MIYFDNASTTKPFDEINQEIGEVSCKLFGNPSSLHRLGIEAERLIKETKRLIGSKINASSDEIYFTSGGTEANNLAIIGCALANKKRGNKIITSNIEHPSVMKTMEYLKSEGFVVEYVNVYKNEFDYDSLEKLIDSKTILVSIMHTNNETGFIFDVGKIGNIIKKKNQNVYFHVDAVQSFLKESIDVNQFNCDFLSVSAHKIHGFKGIGCLYIKKGSNIKPILYGGEQEKGIRPGTENLIGIYSFKKAIELYDIKKKAVDINKIKETFIEKLSSFENVIINSDANITSPYILNVSFVGINSEVMLHVLEKNGVFASAGAACSSKGRDYNKVLDAMGYPRDISKSSIRFSFSVLNSIDEIDYVIKVLDENLERIRKIYK